MAVKKLMRSREDKMIAGVCGGIANYFEIDPTIVRVIFVLFGLQGVGVLLYIALIILMPLPAENASST